MSAFMQDFEPGLYRAWWGIWNFELAYGKSFRWAGVKWSASRDAERGRTLAVGLWWASFYVVRNWAAAGRERSVGVWFDDEHLSAQAYAGSDERNSMPWMWEWPWRRWVRVRTDVLGGSAILPYRYERENGEVQETTATVRLEEREWHWLRRGFPFRRRIRRSVWCEFADPIGEGVDTWKGGTTGAGTDLRPGEDAVAAVRRMERERRFSR